MLQSPPSEYPSSTVISCLQDHKLVNVWNDVRDFSAVANVLVNSEDKLQPELFQEIMLSLQYRLLTLEYDVNTQSLKELVRLGLLAYETTIFLQIPGTRVKYHTLAEQLKYAIAVVGECDVTTDSQHLEGIQELKLWILVTASVAIIEPEDDWLRENIALLLLKIGITTWLGLRKRMKDIMWVNYLHDAPVKRTFDAAREWMSCQTL